MRRILRASLLAGACLVSTSDARNTAGFRAADRAFLAAKPLDPSSLSAHHSSSILLDIRGGASKRKTARTATLNKTKTATGKKKVGAAKKEKKSPLSDSLQKYKQILPLTRIYISMVGIVTLVGMVLGEELTQALFALDPLRVLYGLELWRPLTAACFLGPPSVGWLMSGYYLFEYGSTLERAYGTPQHLIFLICQVILLSILSALLGQPFFAPSMITAMLHVLSRAMPHQKVKWLVFTVPYWALPYGLAATDILQAGSPLAAIPHVLGILSGHFYHFHKFVWPKMGGVDWLVAPELLVEKLTPASEKSPSKAAMSSALKSRKRGKGRKLGGK